VRLERLDLEQDGALVLVVVEGSHFLWRMVRRLVGVLVAVGRGELDVAAAAALLDGPSALPARLTAPAAGLFLDRVTYAGDTQETRVRPVTPIW
jgi:tRNA pseudouridine38-40 synthase